MKIYISGAISKEFNYMKKFKEAEEYLKTMGHVPLNPTVIPPILSYDEHMKIDLAMVEVCDAIYMLKGWENSKGANIEYVNAINNKKIILFQ